MADPVMLSRFDLVLNIGVDSSEAVTAYIDYVKPISGEEGSWSATAVSSEQKIMYEVQDTDIDEPGLWRVQSYITTLDGSKHGEPADLMIKPQARAPSHTHS